MERHDLHKDVQADAAYAASPRAGPRKRFRALWISDVHLGSPGCKAAALADFLEQHECEQLYLVGDIVDVWKLRSRWFWTSEHSRVVGCLLEKAERGTRVLYLAGNHDSVLRPLLVRKLHYRLIELADECVHVTADGRRLLVIHGDRFDAVTTWGFLPLSMAGDMAYTQLMRANRPLNWLRAQAGLPYWSVSAYAKQRTKRVVQWLSGFEDAVVHECRRRKLDGAICGHTHQAEIRSIKHGITYYNCGDWVESCTALAEDSDGRIGLIHWAGRETAAPHAGASLQPKLNAKAARSRGAGLRADSVPAHVDSVIH
jgi:UDP-2,3-diacylglucosamine pyrophosphatase LpxH